MFIAEVINRKLQIVAVNLNTKVNYFRGISDDPTIK